MLANRDVEMLSEVLVVASQRGHSVGDVGAAIGGGGIGPRPFDEFACLLAEVSPEGGIGQPDTTSESGDGGPGVVPVGVVTQLG